MLHELGFGYLKFSLKKSNKKNPNSKFYNWNLDFKKIRNCFLKLITVFENFLIYFVDIV